MALYFANTAHLRSGGSFAVLGGLTDLDGALALVGGVAVPAGRACAVRGHGYGPDPGHFRERLQRREASRRHEIKVALAELALVIVPLAAGRFSLDALIERVIAADGTRLER